MSAPLTAEQCFLEEHTQHCESRRALGDVSCRLPRLGYKALGTSLAFVMGASLDGDEATYQSRRARTKALRGHGHTHSSLPHVWACGEGHIRTAPADSATAEQ